MEIGDKVLVGPWVVKSAHDWNQGRISASIREGSHDAMYCDGLMKEDAMPWHPALPAVAEWLAKYPGVDGIQMLRDVVENDASYRYEFLIELVDNMSAATLQAMGIKGHDPA